jgi:putative transposase
MAIDNKLIDQVLTDYKKPEDIIGENGLLKELTKAILGRALAAETTDLSSSDFRCGPANLWGRVLSRCAMGSGGAFQISAPR